MIWVQFRKIEKKASQINTEAADKDSASTAAAAVRLADEETVTPQPMIAKSRGPRTPNKPSACKDSAGVRIGRVSKSTTSSKRMAPSTAASGFHAVNEVKDRGTRKSLMSAAPIEMSGIDRHNSGPPFNAGSY